MEILSLLSAKAFSNGLEFIVVGGHAVNSYQVLRTTADLDLAISADYKEAWTAILQALKYSIVREQKTFRKFKGPEPGYWPIDLMFLSQDTFQKMKAEAQEHTLVVRKICYYRCAPKTYGVFS